VVKKKGRGGYGLREDELFRSADEATYRDDHAFSIFSLPRLFISVDDLEPRVCL